MALVPMGTHIFFLAQSLTIAYVAVYATVLWARYRKGIVTPAMMSFARSEWRFFATVGLLDTASQLLGLLGRYCTVTTFQSSPTHSPLIINPSQPGAAKLPGVLLPLFQQTFILWQLVFGALLLKRKYSPQQLLGAALVIGGASMAASSAQLSAGSLAQQVFFGWEGGGGVLCVITVCDNVCDNGVCDNGV